MTADTVCLQVGMVPPVAMAAGKHKLTSLSHAGVRNSSQREKITFLSKPTHKIYNRTHTHTHTYIQKCTTAHTNTKCITTQTHDFQWIREADRICAVMFSLANKVQTDLVTVHPHYCFHSLLSCQLTRSMDTQCTLSLKG